MAVAEPAGRETHYRLTPAPLADAMRWIATAGGEWDDRMRRRFARRAPRAAWTFGDRVTGGPCKLLVADPAARDVARLEEKYAAAILEALQHIAESPRRRGKPLRLELEGHWSARRGPYRIIYAIDEDDRTVRVGAVAHRAHVYRTP